MNFYGRPAAGDPEHRRLVETRDGRANWRRWGPYLADRQWGTVREDYSEDGDAWGYQPHDDARSRAYRWGEDGLLGISDERGRLNFALALWNGRDPILKERLFGLTGPEGNHGEDVKEVYAHLDATPTGSYLKALYRYPQARVPVRGPASPRTRAAVDDAPEYELADTGILDEDRFFDVVIEYAKAGPEDIVIRIAATNRGPEPATLHLLPTLWYRNTWSWGHDPEQPSIGLRPEPPGPADACSRRTGGWATTGSPSTARRRGCSPATTRTRNGSSGRPTRRRTSRTPSMRRSSRDGPTPSIPPAPGRRPPRTSSWTGPRGDRDGPAPIGARGRRDAVLGRRHGPRAPG